MSNEYEGDKKGINFLQAHTDQWILFTYQYLPQESFVGLDGDCIGLAADAGYIEIKAFKVYQGLVKGSTKPNAKIQKACRWIGRVKYEWITRIWSGVFDLE